MGHVRQVMARQARLVSAGSPMERICDSWLGMAGLVWCGALIVAGFWQSGPSDLATTGTAGKAGLVVFRLVAHVSSRDRLGWQWHGRQGADGLNTDEQVKELLALEMPVIAGLAA